MKNDLLKDVLKWVVVTALAGCLGFFIQWITIRNTVASNQRDIAVLEAQVSQLKEDLNEEVLGRTRDQGAIGKLETDISYIRSTLDSVNGRLTRLLESR